MEIRGNLIREAVAVNSVVHSKEDVFVVPAGGQSVFTCSFYAQDKEAMNVFVEGIYNSKNKN